MKIVFLSWAYPPMAYPRAFQVGRLVRGLAEHKIQVICADHAGNGAEFDENVPNVNVTRIKQPISVIFHKILARLFSRKLLLVPDQNVGWAVAASNHIISNLDLGSQDVLVTFGQPMSDHIAGLRIKKKTGVNWIAHFSDPWVKNPFLQLAGKLLKLNQKQEHDVLMNCDHAIFTSAETVDLVMDSYPETWREKITVLPHIFDPEITEETALEKADTSDKIVIRSLGHFYGTRSPEPLILAVKQVMRETPTLLEGVSIELVGNVDNWPEGSAGEGVEGIISCPGAVSAQEATRMTQESDVLLVVDSKAEQSVFLPSKLVDYIGVKRPIFAITPKGTAEKLVSRYGGWVADPSDIADIGQKLRDVIEYIRSNGPNNFGNKNVRQEFTMPHVAKKFSEVMMSIIEK